MQATRFAERESVSARIAGFMSHLRLNGRDRSLPDSETALLAMEKIDLTARDEVRLALQAICCRSREDREAFDDLFAAYWLAAGRQRMRPQSFTPADRATTKATTRLQADEIGNASGGSPDMPDGDDKGETEQGGHGRLVASLDSSIRRTDLRHLTTPEELAEAEQLAFRLARAMRDRRSRRLRQDQKGARLDLRRVLRRSVAFDGEPMRLYRKRRPDRPVHLVALLDVSGSMTLYARVFLAFLRGLVSVDSQTDAFLFHTRLTKVSDALRDSDSLRAVERLSLMANGFGGGTKIGETLKSFNDHYARATVTGRSVVIILSDGYDTGPAERLGEELARLKRRGCRILWLNPLKGWKDYQPVARGMAAALPHLDLFAAANTLDALADLEPHLARL